MAVKCPDCKSIVTSRDGYCPVCDSALEPMRRPFNWRPLLLAAIILGGAVAVWTGCTYFQKKAERFYHENIIERAVGEEDAEYFDD